MLRSSRFLFPLVLIAVASIVLIGVSLWLNSGSYCSACQMILRVDGVSFASSGWVNFHLTNPASWNISISQVNASMVIGSNVTYLSSVSVSSNNVVRAGGTLDLPVQFRGLAWQVGVRYWFILVSSTGEKYPIAAIAGCPNGC